MEIERQVVRAYMMDNERDDIFRTPDIVWMNENACTLQQNRKQSIMLQRTGTLIIKADKLWNATFKFTLRIF